MRDNCGWLGVDLPYQYPAPTSPVLLRLFRNDLASRALLRQAFRHARADAVTA